MVSGLCVFEWLCYCIAQFFVDFHISISWFSSSLGILGALCGQAALNLGLLNMTPILVSELCAQAARAVISEIVQVIPLLICFFMVLLYPSAVSQLGFATYIPLIAISAMLFYLLYKNLPETRGLPVDKIVRRLSVTRSRRNTIRSLLETHHVHYGSFANSEEELIANEEHID
uniref:Uncharacterized protein n=1 Tax=Acrobeloides nanus TaxID=290746 RepID=A0A914D8Q3_9BILA